MSKKESSWYQDLNKSMLEARHIQELEEENHILTEMLSEVLPVLKFYANDENYTYQEREIKRGESITHFKQSEIEKDRGEKARKLIGLE